MIIIGVLAAIAIPIYLGVQNSAKDSAVKSDLTNAKIAVVAAYTADPTFVPSGTLTAATAAGTKTLGDYGFTSSGNYAGTGAQALKVFTGSTGTKFCIDAIGFDTKTAFRVTGADGVKPGACTAIG